ncbi:MAG: hypothetical protein AABZ80_02135 [Gemmatimonadota bacterium]
MRRRTHGRVATLAVTLALAALADVLSAQMPAVDSAAADSVRVARTQTLLKHSRAGQVLYQRLPYGSQGYFSPLTVLLNKGFDHFQAKNARRDVWRFPYERAFRNNVFDALANPGRAIEFHPGWHRWIRSEVLPFTFTTGEARWAVNYTEHMLAGGLTYRALDEWFRVRDVPLPRLLAAATTFGAAMINEAVENPDVTSGTSGSVADLLVFDLGGILLFDWDPLVRFFGGTLQGADWSNLATFTTPNAELRNSGQYYVLKIPMPWTRTRLFLRGGMGVQSGLSRRVRGEHSLTVALGADTEMRNVEPVTGAESIRLKFGGGVYWDRRNSLLASVNFSPNADAVKVNVFPGVLPGVGRDLGTWVALTREGHLMAGIVSRRALGLGAGLGW